MESAFDRRRALLGGVALGASMIGGGLYLNNNREILRQAGSELGLYESAYHSYNEYTPGRKLSTLELEKLFSSVYTHEVPEELSYTIDSQIIASKRVFIPEDGLLVGKVRGVNDTTVSVPVVGIRIDDTNIAVPVVQSGKTNTGLASLGFQSKSEIKKVNFIRSDFSNSVTNNSHKLDLSVVWSEDPVVQSILAMHPRFAELDSTPDYSPNGVLDQANYFSEVEVKNASDHDGFTVTYWQYYFKEPGRDSVPQGGSTPTHLWNEYGRTFDRDAVFIVKMARDGLIREIAHMDKRHEIVVDFISDPPVSFQDVDYNLHLEIIPAHGMVTYNPDRNPEYYYSNFALPWEMLVEDFDEDYFQYASQIESLRQHILLGSLSTDADPVQKFIKKHDLDLSLLSSGFNY